MIHAVRHNTRTSIERKACNQKVESTQLKRMLSIAFWEASDTFCSQSKGYLAHLSSSRSDVLQISLCEVVHDHQAIRAGSSALEHVALNLALQSETTVSSLQPASSL
jgi:hypothetical protein